MIPSALNYMNQGTARRLRVYAVTAFLDRGDYEIKAVFHVLAYSKIDAGLNITQLFPCNGIDVQEITEPTILSMQYTSD